jgi:calcium-dependent protein kinase
MLSGKPPFKGKSKEEIFHAVTHQNISFADPIWKRKISPEAKEIVKNMLVRNPSGRLSADEILNSSWIQSNIDKIELDSQELLDIAHNLERFRSFSVFQTGVMAFILTFNEKYSELDRLRELFIQLDTSNDGKLSLNEIKEGLCKVMGNVKANQQYFEDIL